jgi:hypothetical protein
MHFGALLLLSLTELKIQQNSIDIVLPSWFELLCKDLFRDVIAMIQLFSPTIILKWIKFLMQSCYQSQQKFVCEPATSNFKLAKK